METSRIVFVAASVLVAAAILVALAVAWWCRRRTHRLLIETHREDALVQSWCMIRDGARQCPGVASIADDMLHIHPVLGQERHVPLADLTVRKEGIGYGRIPWIGTRVFYLQVPGCANLAIGVRDPLPWRQAFARGSGDPAAGDDGGGRSTKEVTP